MFRRGIRTLNHCAVQKPKRRPSPELQRPLQSSTLLYILFLSAFAKQLLTATVSFTSVRPHGTTRVFLDAFVWSFCIGQFYWIPSIKFKFDWYQAEMTGVWCEDLLPCMVSSCNGHSHCALWSMIWGRRNSRRFQQNDRIWSTLNVLSQEL